MAINIGLILICAIVGLVLGLAIGGIYTVTRIFWFEYKARKNFKDKKGYIENKTKLFEEEV